jgi:hypothetical protein
MPRSACSVALETYHGASCERSFCVSLGQYNHTSYAGSPCFMSWLGGRTFLLRPSAVCLCALSPIQMASYCLNRDTNASPTSTNDHCHHCTAHRHVTGGGDCFKMQKTAAEVVNVGLRKSTRGPSLAYRLAGDEQPFTFQKAAFYERVHRATLLNSGRK